MSENSMNDAVTMRPQAGASLGRIDQYELIRELGGGGFGCVYLAKDTVSGIEVAVKGLSPLIRQNKEELENVRNNFALVSRLHHPNIAAALTLHPVTIASYNDESDAEKLRVFGGDMLVVMQYARGVTLSQWRKQFPDGKVPLDKALVITRQIASALDYAHEEKILHRDIKPANVMIETGDDGSLTARVLDFGLAAEIRSSMSRVSQSITDTSGTRPYMAPEQWGGREQGKESDLYSLAVLFYELIVGKVPFASVFDTGDTVLMKNVVENGLIEGLSVLPRFIRHTIAKALAKKREDRFASCMGFIQALDGKIRFYTRLQGGKKWKVAARIVLTVAACGGLRCWQDFKFKGQERAEAEAKAVERTRVAEESARKAWQKIAENRRVAEEVRMEQVNDDLERRKKEDVRMASGDSVMPPAPVMAAVTPKCPDQRRRSERELERLAGDGTPAERPVTQIPDAGSKAGIEALETPAKKSVRTVWRGFTGQDKRRYDLVRKILDDDLSEEKLKYYTLDEDKRRERMALAGKLRSEFQALEKAVRSRDESLAKRKLKRCIDLYNEL
jgi:hypothetical protein